MVVKIKAKFHSTAIKKMEYDASNKVMSVTFTGGKSYDYYDVPFSEVTSFVSAESAGKYFNAHIKPYSWSLK